DILEQYQAFRSDWELNNMIPFTKMLADRQIQLRNQSRKLSAAPVASPSMHRRQQKILDLCQLIQPAFADLAARLNDQEPVLGQAFLAGSKILLAADLVQPLVLAAEHARASRWSDAAQQQTLAGEKLTVLHEMLRKAQLDVAQKALAALKDKLKSDLQM